MKTITVQYVSLAQRVLTRFAKVFLLGAISSMLVVPPLAGLDVISAKAFLLSMVNALIVGGLAALEKYVSSTT